MAININKVYKTVLSILNKEQRGYLTPAEYNNLAQQSQREILDKLFYDYNRFLNLDNFNRINEGLADIPSKIQEQLDEFYTYADITLTDGVGALPTDLYKILDVSITNQTVEVEKVDKSRLSYLKSSPLTKPTTTFPVYYQRAADIVVEPALTDAAWTLGALRMQYIQVPANPRWGYTTNATYGTQLYDTEVFVATGAVLGSRGTGIISTNQTVGLTDGTVTLTLGSDGVITSGSGTGLVFTVTVSGSTITAINITAAGTGFAVGDTITIPHELVWMGADDAVLTLRASDLYNSSTRGSTNFTLHESNETELIISILGYAGFVIKDPSVLQAATQLSQAGAMSKAQQ